MFEQLILSENIPNKSDDYLKIEKMFSTEHGVLSFILKNGERQLFQDFFRLFDGLAVKKQIDVLDLLVNVYSHAVKKSLTRFPLCSIIHRIVNQIAHRSGGSPLVQIFAVEATPAVESSDYYEEDPDTYSDDNFDQTHIEIDFGTEHNQIMLEYPNTKLKKGDSLGYFSKEFVCLWSRDGGITHFAERNPGEALIFFPIDDLVNDARTMPFGSNKKRVDDLLTLERVHSIRSGFQFTTGIDLRKMYIRDQIALIDFLSEKNNTRWVRLSNILQEHGEDFQLIAQAFLGMDDSRSDFFLEKVSTMQWKLVRDILIKYSDLNKAINVVEKDAKKFFHLKNELIDTRTIIQEFVKRSTKLLFDVLENPEQAVKDFNGAQQDVLMFGSIFKAAVKTGVEFKLEDVAGLDIASFSGKDLPPELRRSLKEISAANWLARGVVGKKIIESFNEVVDIGDENRIWYVLCRGNDVVSFIRFDVLKNTNDERLHEYSGSFNVHPAYRGSVIGEAMINEVLIHESKNAILHGTLDPRIEVGTRYVEEVGYLVTGVIENYLDTPESFFEVIADQSVLKNYKSRGWSREDVIEFAREHSREPLVVQAERGDIIVASVTRDAGAEPEFISAAAEILRAGFVGTRYIPDGPDSKVRYMIFEKIK